MTLLARALSLERRLLVLDEPTAALTEHEREQAVRGHPATPRVGVGVLYVSHRLDEVFEIADTYTVLRNGGRRRRGDRRHVAAAVITAMAGRSIDTLSSRCFARHAARCSPVRGLTGRRIREFSLDVRAARSSASPDSAGSGRSELLRIVGGACSRRTPARSTSTASAPRPAVARAAAAASSTCPRSGAPRADPGHRERNLNATTIGRHAALGPLCRPAAERQHARGLW